MPMTIVKGHYRIVGASPDGDSVRFSPQDPGVWETAGIPVRSNSTGGVQLRLDAIDALETHYTPPHARSPWRQPAALGNGAAAALLELLGFRNVVRDERGYVTSATPEQTPGYILTRFADKYGRAVATVFTGGRRGRAVDGGSIYLDVDELHRSVNYQLLATGWVYPTFYSKLYVDLRADLTAATVAARATGTGVWAEDATLPGFRLSSRTQLTEDLVVLPKLFRRLAEYLSLDETGKVSLARFPAFLAAHDDRLFTVPTGQATSLDTLIARRGQTLTLTLPPEQIVFLEG
jgi:endonuclease YncB( thermonuclease family)